MTELPQKMYWLGQDVETLPRDTLLDIVRHLGGQVEQMRDKARRDAQFYLDVARARGPLNFS